MDPADVVIHEVWLTIAAWFSHLFEKPLPRDPSNPERLIGVRSDFTEVECY